MHIKSFRQKDRYGNEVAVEFFEVPEMQVPEYDHPGDPKGPDTVPAWLTPGEFVVNAEAVRMFEPEIEAMNDAGREIQAAQGGTIPEGGSVPNEPVYASSGFFNDITRNIKRNTRRLKRDPSKFLSDFVEDTAKGVQDIIPDIPEVSIEVPSVPTKVPGGRIVDPTTGEVLKQYYNTVEELSEDGIILRSPGGAGIYRPKDKDKTESRGGTILDFGDVLFEADGGPVPVYADEGSFIDTIKNFFTSDDDEEKTPMSIVERNLAAQSGRITPELLDAVRQVESSGGTNAVPSKAGALGEYQIIPSEDMGYGIGPYLTPGEDADKDREIATAYLAGIANENPDYTLAEVLQAYNAGPTRFANFKANKGDPLKDETINYPGKVAAALGVPVESFMDIADVKEVDYELRQLKAERHKIDKLAPPIRSSREAKDAHQARLDEIDSRIADKEALLASSQAANTFNNRGEVGVHNQIVRDGYTYTYDPEKEAYFDKEGREYYRGIGEYLSDTGRDLIDSITEPPAAYQVEGDTVVGTLNGDPVYKDSKGTFYQTLGRNNHIRGDVLPYQLDNIEFLPEDKRTIVPPKPEAEPELEDLEGKKPNDTKPVATSTAKDISDEADQNTQTGSPPLSFEDMLKQTGYQLNPDGSISKIKETTEEEDTLMNKAMSGFMNMFGGMFDEAELGRMALIYAGSRALGYDHSGSISYSMKNYINNVDTKLKERRKFITSKDALKNYTTKSLKEYMRTGDVTDLKKKPGSGGVKKRGDKIYHRLLGVLPTFIGTDDIEYVNIKGKPFRLDDPNIAPFLEDFQESLHDEGNIKKSFRTDGAIYLKSANMGREEAIPESTAIKISDEAITLYNTKKLRYGGMDAISRSDLMRNINLAQDDYYKALAAHLNDKDNRKPQSLEEFFNARMINIDTGGILSYNDIKGTDTDRFANINRTMEDRAYKEASEDPKKASIAYKRIVKQYKDAWDKYVIMANAGDARKNFLNAGGEKTNSFMNWIYQCQQGNKDALEVFEIVKQK